MGGEIKMETLDGHITLTMDKTDLHITRVVSTSEEVQTITIPLTYVEKVTACIKALWWGE